MDKDAYGKEETKVESETTIEDLYKYFGILADAKENASEVYLVNLTHTDQNILKFKYFI